MASMATPISQLPTNNAPPVSGGAEDDPLIMGVLQDMESKMQPPPQQQQHYQAPPPMPPHQQQYPTNIPISRYNGPPRAAPIWSPEIAQRALIIAIVAFVVLNPAILQALFKAVPVLESYIGAYSTVVSMLLLIIVLYILMKFTRLV